MWQVRGDDDQPRLEWTEQGQGVWRNTAAQWVIDRSQCLFRSLDLSHVPRAQRSQALAMKLQGSSPYRNSGHYAVWRGGVAMLWMWDQELQQRLLQEAGNAPKRLRCIPESLLQSPMEASDGLQARLLAVRQGVDLQVWQAGRMLLSIYFPGVPAAAELKLALRSIPGAEGLSVPQVDAGDYLATPWASMGGQGIYADWERWVPHGLLAALLLGLSFQLTQGISWWGMERGVLDDHAQLVKQIETLLDARNRAQQANAEATLLHQRMQAAPAQIALLKQLHGLLPPDSRLLSWRFHGDELALQILTGNMDPRFFVQRLQDDGKFRNVRVEPSSRGEGLQLTMALR